jgi:hypothetical protein
MTQHWAWQFGKLSSAVGVLISHPGDARERVWASSGYLLQISPDVIPPECREDIAWIHHMLTRYPKGEYDDSNLRATYRRTRNVTACKIAARVWHAYHVYDSAMQSPAYKDRPRPKGIFIVPPKSTGA